MPGRETLARRRRVDHQLDDLLAELVGRRRIRAAARKDEEPQDSGDPAVREVAQQAVELLLRLVEQRAARPLDERQILRRLALVLVVLEHHRREVQIAQDVAEPRRDQLAALELAAEREHRGVRDQRERRAVAVDVLVVAARRPAGGHVGEARERHGHDERARGVRQRVAQVLEQQTVERGEPGLVIGIARGVHLGVARTDGSESRPGRR